MSGTVTESCYCWSLLGLETTVTVDVCYGYRELLLLVTAGGGDHCYSGCLLQLQRTVTAGHCWSRRPLLQWMSGSMVEPAIFIKNVM